MLIEHSFEQAVLLGFDVVVILGSPMNYVGCGFKSSRKLNICMENGKYPAAMMVKNWSPINWTAENGSITTALLWQSLRKKHRNMIIP